MYNLFDISSPKAIFCPSILSADFAKLAEEVHSVEPGAHWIHVDVMDGHFVPNLTLGPPLLKSLRPYTKLPLDCHLMVTNPDDLLEDFAAAGADGITVHVEACRHLHRTIQRIKTLGMRAGVSLNPATPLASLEEILPEVDLVLLMSVNPGFGGQSFIPSTLDKIRRLRACMQKTRHQAHIQVDGGIGTANISDIYRAGANCLVAGSAIFCADDRLAVLESFAEQCDVNTFLR